ncbi:hypothetical protein, partial [Paenibacillus sp. 2TAB19]|uniref:hypothetical protein n=1 Tax=Paenibacillus sp. 2TAB19 TaxID=3233003 RepID=UPI003F952890
MKRITLLSAFTIVFLLTGSIVWANYDQWSSFKKDEGVIQSQDGILTKIPSDQEKLEVVNSIDPALGIPLKELGSATPVNG